MPPLGDGPGTPLDQGVATVLFIAAFGLGWVGVTRLRRKGFGSVAPAAAWALTAGAVACLVLAIVLPPIIRPVVASSRPRSTATVTILTPRSGQRIEGDPAVVPVRLHLAGGRIVPFTSRNLVPNEGHIHLYLDGVLTVMTTGLRTVVRARPGPHRLIAEFVAVDHAPFDPPVQSIVQFRVTAP